MEKAVFENPCSLEMLRRIAAYEKKVFGDDAIPFPKMLQFWKKNPFMFSALRSGSRFLGYSDIFFPNKKGLEIIKGGKSIDVNLTADCFYGPREMNKATALYIDAIGATGSGEHRKNFAAMLMYGRAFFFERRFRLPKRAYVIPATPEGMRLVKSYGAVQIGKASINVKVYPLFSVTVDGRWCERVKARAERRAVPEISFASVK